MKRFVSSEDGRAVAGQLLSMLQQVSEYPQKPDKSDNSDDADDADDADYVPNKDLDSDKEEEETSDDEYNDDDEEASDKRKNWLKKVRNLKDNILASDRLDKICELCTTILSKDSTAPRFLKFLDLIDEALRRRTNVIPRSSKQST